MLNAKLNSDACRQDAMVLLTALRRLTEEIDRDLPITAAMVFFRVAHAGDAGIDQGTVQEEMDMSSASMSRTVQTLGRVHYLKDRPGYDLVSREMDPTDNRRRVLRLTPRGDQLNRRVLEVLER